MNFIGEIAALATAFFFAMTALIFTSTGRSVGSQVTNRMRLLIALLYLIVLNILLFREPLPFSAGSSRWIWPGLSGIIGLSLGDAFLFQSYVSIGPQLGSLLLSLAPIFGSIIAWVFFGEVLTLLQIIGIVLTLAGIAWVVLSHEEPAGTPDGHTRRGVIFGVLAAVSFVWVWATLEGKAGSTFQDLRGKPRVVSLIALGALVGPVLGVSSSLFAVQHAEIGVVSTLVAASPNQTLWSV